MALLARFIGINRYVDLRIRDLTGARRDATALWALFCDTIPDIKAEVIVDVDATMARVRRALDETLVTAGPEDTVILSFAGHGTHDHRLVLHDSVENNLADTTISVEEIADRFKISNAKAVLFILDCCFSGGAPARVLESSPIPRNPGSPLQELAGEGRILIAASNIDERAYELPGNGHGLLTKALIDVLQTEEGSINVLAAMTKIMERVQAEAGRISVKQTPVLFGNVTGGLSLPTLRPGANYFREFPEARGIQINHNIDELKAFGLPENLLHTWRTQFEKGLNSLQQAAVNEYRILDGDSLLVVAPTSSGKTFIGEMAAAKAIVEGRKSVFLFPFRALTNEKYDQFLRLYGETLGMRVIRCTGDYADQTSPFVGGKFDLALLTYEMFLNLVLNVPAVLHNLGLIVVDEAQFITDPNRGITVELLFTNLLAARERGINPQLITLSAVIGNVNEFDAWLGCKKLVTDKRPVSLIEGVFDRSGQFQYLDASGAVKVEQLLPSGVIRQRRDKPSSQDMIVPLVQKLIRENKYEKVIIFRNRRGYAEGAANYLAQDLGLSPALEALSALPNHDLSSTSTRLRNCLNGGTAFHNTNLTRKEKSVVERVFRDPQSKVRVLGATTTVAAGLNTPASTVIIAEQEFVGEDGRPFTVAEYKNMAGRAGRVGFQEEGKAIILAENSIQREQLFRKYVMGNLESLQSTFDPSHIETWVIRLLAQITRVPRAEVTRLLANTYGGYLANQGNPKWRTEMAQRLEQLLERMITLDLVEQEQEYVQLTLLGRACGRSSLSFQSAMRLVDLARKISLQELTAVRLMALLQALPELDSLYTPMLGEQKEMIRQREAVERYGNNVVRVMQSYVPNAVSYYARCKRAAILWDWVHGVAVEAIETQYSTKSFRGRIGYGDIRKFADTARYHLRSAYQIMNIMFLGEGFDEEAMENLIKQLEVGIPGDALELLSVPLERGEYLELYRRGIKTSENLLALSYDSLEEFLGSDRAKQIEKHRSSAH